MSASAVFWCLIVLFVLAVAVLALIYRLRDQKLARQKAEKEASVRQQAQRIVERLVERSPEELAGMPGDTVIGPDNLPKEVGAKQWGNKYTFYESFTGHSYHVAKCKASPYGLFPVNAWTVYNSQLSPCSKCNPILPDLAWFGRYLRILTVLHEYGITPIRYEKPSSDFFLAEAKDKDIRELQKKIAVLSSQVEKYKTQYPEKEIDRRVMEKYHASVDSVLKRGFFRGSFVSFDFNTKPIYENNGRLMQALRDDAEIIPPVLISTLVQGSAAEPYTVTLDSCTCKDFENNKQPCKHMYLLALELGLLLSVDMTETKAAMKRLSASHARNKRELDALQKLRKK